MNNNTTDLDRELEAIARMSDAEIDTSDVPEVKDWSKAVVGKFYRPVKQSVTIRLDADVVACLKAEGAGYQTRLNAMLREIIMGEIKDDALSGTECGESPNRFYFPSLERHEELDKYNRVAARIQERKCVFAAAA